MSEIPLPLNTPGNFRKKIEDIIHITSSQGKIYYAGCWNYRRKKCRLGFINMKTIAFWRTLIRKWTSNTYSKWTIKQTVSKFEKKKSLWLSCISQPYKSTIKSAIKIGQKTWTGVSWVIGHTSETKDEELLTANSFYEAQMFKMRYLGMELELRSRSRFWHGETLSSIPTTNTNQFKQMKMKVGYLSSTAKITD